eukprot:gnl/Dysnectes_brevis/6830_a10885_415.p1 GENE.gnl/Dysnectes_brevis/6830_a10885_415~~gnl/Dysnectes_brevis/6830_a10885_415.p1  ORF type:complete len:262 (-),score=26.95 gnl/Dysnectes_brevis/6830_a10885_415:33-818(-)
MGVLNAYEVTGGSVAELAALVYNLYVKRRKRNDCNAVTINPIFYLAILGHATRILWLICRSFLDDTYVDFFLNRVSLSALLASFSLYCNRCFKVSSKYNVASPCALKVMNALVIFSLSVMAIILVIFLFTDDREGSPIYEFNTLFISLVWAFVSVIFMGAGIHVVVQLRRSPSFTNQPRIVSFTRQITVSSIVCALASMERALCFMWRPLTGEYSPKWLYVAGFYVMPDVVPSILIAWQMDRSARNRRSTPMEQKRLSVRL